MRGICRWLISSSKGGIPAGRAVFLSRVHNPPPQKLEAAFGEKPARLHHRLQVPVQNAKRREFGDMRRLNWMCCLRVPLTIVISSSDEEFASRASILFDQTAAAHLPLDAL